MAYLSRELGTIDLNAPIDKKLEDMQITEWDKQKVVEIFTKLKFNRFIERFNLKKEQNYNEEQITDLQGEEISGEQLETLKQEIKENKKIYYYLITKPQNGIGITNTIIEGITVYSEKANKAYLILFLFHHTYYL